MRRYCALGLAASALFIATIGCQNSLVKPLPVSAAMAQAGPATTATSKAEIVVTKEKLAGYVVAKGTDTLSFESDGDISYDVLFPTKDPTRYPPACNPTTTDVKAEHPVTPNVPFTCFINPPTQAGGKVYYKIGKFKAPAAAPVPAGSGAAAPPPPPPPPPIEFPSNVVHCNHC